MRAADEEKAVVVAITASGAIFIGGERAEPDALNRLSDTTVYVKADVRAPYRTVFAVLDALHGKSVVLLNVPPDYKLQQGYIPPYGTKLIVSR